MHHEILLSLLGHCGEIVISSNSSFKINPELSFIPSTEHVLLNQLVILGSQYLSLTASTSNHNHNRISFYNHALSLGIKNYLKEYRNAILDIESKIIAEKAIMSYVAIKIHMAEYLQTFPYLMTLMEKIQEKNKVHVIQYLYTCEQNTGFPYLKKCIQLLRQPCQQYVLCIE